jgi:predicted ABC-type transport system involved in lysophospholipase L1 biosynthesis ATPase subunit
MASATLIEMQAARKTYPMGDLTVHALRGLDLTVARGEFIVLLGHSGWAGPAKRGKGHRRWCRDRPP